LPRIERRIGVLHDKLNRTAQSLWTMLNRIGNIFVLEENLAAPWPQEATDRPYDGGFAAAGFAD
jgi:hypothetical protein